MGAEEIKSIIISFDKIRDAAEQFRQDHIHNEDIPVNIEWHVEAAFGIAIIPVDGLHSETQIDGLISKDLKYIYVDNDLYNDDRYQGRVRFTIAHEIGHYILHYDTIQSIKCKNERNGLSFIGIWMKESYLGTNGRRMNLLEGY